LTFGDYATKPLIDRRCSTAAARPPLIDRRIRVPCWSGWQSGIVAALRSILVVIDVDQEEIWKC
jgi:rhodanese-related sulfurtransferase